MTTSSEPRDLHVLIIGAGITGLLLAQGLKHAGIRTTIFEKEPTGYQANRGWTMAIHWSLPHLKTLLPPELHARLPEAYCDPFGGSIEKTTIYNSASGEVLKEIVMPGMIRVDRNRMRALCSEGLDIYYSKALSGLQYGNSGKGITASFADGTSMVGDMVVGADGPHSAVRTELLGKEVAAAKSSNLVSFMSTVNYKDAEKARHVRSGNPIFCMAYNPAGIMNFISVQNVLDPEDPTTWSFSISSSWVGQLDPTLDNAGRLAALKQKIGDNCGEPFKSAIEWIPDDDTTTIMGRISYWVTEPWDNHGGRVTLAGDAAHPMTPYRGQGLNHCIADVASLVKLLVEMKGKSELTEVVSKYEAEMIPRGKAEVISSVENAIMLHDWDLIMKSAMMTHGPVKTS